MEVKIEKGIVVLKKPTAGIRNRALMKAETPDGIKNTVLMVEILPHCILSHPFGTVPISHALDALSVEEYDNLINKLFELMGVGDVEKKLEKPSELPITEKKSDTV